MHAAPRIRADGPDATGRQLPSAANHLGVADNERGAGCNRTQGPSNSSTHERTTSMTRTLLTTTLILALGIGVLTSPPRATAKAHMDMMAMAMAAKTPADHEKLGAKYDQEAA